MLLWFAGPENISMAVAPVASSTIPAKTRVFISYSRKDLSFADWLEAALKARSLEPLIDRIEIYAFEDWWKRIQALIGRADTVVFVLSPDAVKSDVALKEVEYAATLNKHFAPIVCRRVDDNLVPEPLRRLNFIFFDDPTKYEFSADQLAQALQTNIGWIRKHTEYGEAARHWAAAARPAGLLLRSPALEDAEQWIASRPLDAPAPTEDTLDFVVESRRGTTRRRNVLTSSLAAGLLVALGLAGLAYWQRSEALRQERVAVEQRQLAQKNEAQARQERDKALLTQSRFLADAAEQRVTADHATTGLLLALEALPDTRSGIVRPYAPDAEAASFAALQEVRETAVFTGHGQRILTGAFSPDGERVITGGWDGAARIWDAKTGKQVATLGPGKGAVVTAVAFSPDGARIAMAINVDSAVVVCDALTGEKLQTLSGHTLPILSTSFSPNGRQLVTGSANNTAIIWDLSSGRAATVLKGHSSLVRSAVFSPDGQRVATASDDKTIRIWDVATGQQITSLNANERTWDAEFSPDGNRIVSASVDQAAHIWDLESGKLVISLNGHHLPVTTAAFSPDGKLVVTASLDKTARIWEASSGKSITELQGHSDIVTKAGFDRSGERIITASWDGTGRIWRVHPSYDGIRFIRPEGGVVRVRFSPDGTRVLATASTDYVVRVWKSDFSAWIFALRGHVGLVKDAEFSPDGRFIGTASWDRTARIWDASNGTFLEKLEGHTGRLDDAKFSHDGTRLVTASEDKTARIWDVKTGKTLLVLSGHDQAVKSAAFSSDDRFVATASTDTTARIWDAENGKLLATLTGHAFGINSVVFSPNGKRILTASDDKTARIWDLDTRETIATLSGHRHIVLGAVYSSDGRRIATASLDGTARIWEVATAKTIAVLKGRDGDGLSDAVFNPNGSLVLKSEDDGSVGIWHLFASTDALIDEGRKAARHCLTREEREQFFLDSEPPVWCIEMGRWPYQDTSWQEWLKYKRSNLDPPLPSTSAWGSWLATINHSRR
jgi:WD40 repeat protein